MIAMLRSRRLTRRLVLVGTVLPAALVAVLALGGFGPTAAGAGESIAVSLTDGVASAHPGQVLTYQSTVTNSGSTDVSLLLEITIPDGAKVNDAGGGTIRQSLIDYGLTVSANTHSSERFVITLGPAAGQSRVDTVAAVHLLGTAATASSTSSLGSTASAAANLSATDSDQLVATGAAGATATTRASAATAASSAAAAGPAHRGWWIAALVVGALLVLIGLWLALRSGPNGRPRRRSSAVVPAGSRPPATPAIATPAIRTGSHQARRPAR